MKVKILTGVIVLLLVACSTTGNWDRNSYNLTYQNEKEHVFLKFPNERWKVQVKPDESWTKATRTSTNYHILKAEVSELLIDMNVIIDLIPQDVKMKEYMAIAALNFKQRGIQATFQEVHKNNHEIGVGKYKMGDMQCMSVAYKELWLDLKTKKAQSRFVVFNFRAPEEIFKLREEEIWSIIDSYKYR